MLLPLVALGEAEISNPLTDLGRLSISTFLTCFMASELRKSFYFWAENIAGKLVFYQMEGNAFYVRDTGELASYIQTETMFELYDPQKNLSSAKFTYTWDLGNGYEDLSYLKDKQRFRMLSFDLYSFFWCREVIHGTEPVVRYNYSESGNYTLRLKVGVKVTKLAPLLTDVYSTDVQVLGW